MDDFIKKFINWTKLKIRLHLKNEIGVYFYEREVWWASLGVNIGQEQNGKNESFERPILILKKFNKNILWALPLTSQNKTGQFYHQFDSLGNKYSVILSQLRLISSKRLLRKFGAISDNDFENICKNLKNLI